MTRSRSSLALALAALTASCAGDTGGGSAVDDASSGITIADVGFSTPESVLHDPVADIYLVSNVSGAPLDKDGDGFISRVNPEGSVEDLKWIDGSTGAFELNAPKGMAIGGDSLYVVDIDCVRIFHRESGSHADDICFPDASFLNDVAIDDNGVLYVTDSGLDAAFQSTGTDAVYRFYSDGRRAPFIEGSELGAPNGIAFGPRGGFVVTFGSGEMFQLTPQGGRNIILPASPDRQLDGIVFTPDSGILFSSWGSQTVYQVTASNEMITVVEGVDAPADIGFDAQRNRVLIPLFNANEVWIRDVQVGPPPGG